MWYDINKKMCSGHTKHISGQHTAHVSRVENPCIIMAPALSYGSET
jgi:hypothetical protein